MNLVDVKNLTNLYEDENYNTKLTGCDQLTILNCFRKPNGKLFYIIHCSICEKDSELFGEGYFTVGKYHILKGENIPCGCSNFPKWTEEQMRVKIQRICDSKDYIFHGWVGDYRANTTRVAITSRLGYSESLIIARLLAGQGCPFERLVKIGKSKRKSEEEIIESFLKTNAFHPNTKFERTFKNSNPSDFWLVSCPSCMEVVESYRSNLQKGKLPCSCSRHNQTKCYINLLMGDDNCIALKFGKATLPERRLKEQQQRCIYNIKHYGVWQFPDKQSCLKAELECLNTLECRLLCFEEMPDGWSETTSPLNIEKVIEVYERNGGIKI